MAIAVTLDAICEALSCQPGDILQFEPEQTETRATGSGDERPAERARMPGG